MAKNFISSLICLFSFCSFCYAQPVTIDNYSVNGLGQVQLSIEAQASKYYVLHAQHSSTYNWAVSMTLGVNGTMIISESLSAYPLENYSITAHDISAPDDYDGDGINDIIEFNNMPTDSPFNFAEPIAINDGATSIPDADTFLELATVNNVGWAPFLDDQLYVKFGILNRDTDNPQVYFINSNTYTIHASFWSGIGASVTGDDGSGEIVFNPNDILPNGVIGSYSFNFSFGDAYNFEATQRTYELLAASMPFLQNNMNHFIGQSDENDHINNYADDFVGTRVEVVLESDVFAEINYIPFHEAEGYGFFKHMTDLNETPGSRDIVLYDALPNSLPRVGGIITSVIQTPLSHVNLRAIQDNVPNAYIANPLLNDDIANLLGGYVYYKVENEQYEIREATLTEVNNWYEDLRPTEPQIPIRDLSITEIMPLDDISFEMSTAFGAKCSNVATMRSFDLPSGTIPDGFGIPFYYYDEFMKFNNFYQEVQVMIDNPTFQTDLNFRIDRLKDLRRAIKDAPMPQWMMDDLQAMHDAFPVGTAVRCRSSTNNEDLPGFSGAGLYTSKTQYLDEGHISKSIKQVYASMWNFRAYEERDFYRVDHFVAAMGLLCHPNFQGEQSNGVGISIDPIYETEGTFYLNTQVGESLITNPDPNSVPEELLIYEDPEQGGGYLVLRLSNLVNPGELVMDQVYIDQMREFLSVIHDGFEILYNVVGAEGFGVDIEYKVTAQDQLIIKQARPWVSFWANINADNDLGVIAIVEPQSSSSLGNSELVTATIANQGLNAMSNFDIELVVDGQSMETITIPQAIQPFSEADFQFSVPQDFSAIGEYNVTAIVSHPDDEYENNDTLNVVLSKVHELDGAISVGEIAVVCDEVVEVDAIVTNNGASTISELQIEVVVNGSVVEVINTSVDIAFQEQETVTVVIDDNLQQNNNITLNVLNINTQEDQDLTNNSVSTTTSLDSNYDTITLVINADNYAGETSWKLLDEANEIISTGALSSNDSNSVYSEDICVDYTSCFSLYFYDSYGDGICCAYGEGNFQVLDASGNTILTNDGEFDNFAKEVFCLDESGCEITAEVNVTHATSSSANDAVITINTSTGMSPFQYSIDGGETLSDSNTFVNLPPGDYNVFVLGATGLCSFQEIVSVEACDFSSVDIEATSVSSVVSTNGSIVITPTSGEGPYQYSIDGGQTFSQNNVFSNLAVGDYNVVVKDIADICIYEVGVPIEVEGLVINEINYSSSTAFNAGDWIELYNPKAITIDISNWQIKDDNNTHVFIIPEGTQIAGNGFLVIVKDAAAFSSVFPNIPYIGELDFGFGGSDAVRVYNSDSKLMDDVFYDSIAPWPICADETGNTLELMSPDLDNALPGSWSCINDNGSPNAVNSPGLSVEVVDSNSIALYPNPVKNTLYIKGNSGSYDIEVYSILGQRVMTAFDVNEIDVRSFNEGIYLIRVSTKNGTTVKRFIKF
ncbi:MAG: PEP/pyruvate-binding domain-containing protein [Flavobacteriaceae bacterium]|nr:PEP/pyruvate-binding domain-containing protein [Flavobacteriaceae bacterium]MDG2498582.1 PEP/pyruvate-binding domain-containing protein [Flavobacteriaceae bacterium]